MDEDELVTAVDGGNRYERAVDALVARYAAYRQAAPDGPVVVIAATAWNGWSASP